LQHASISKNRLTFVTAGPPSATRPDTEAINGVQRLRQFFQELPQVQTQVALTFEQFGRIRGRDLYGNVQYGVERWANTSDKPWMQAGREMQGLYARSRLVVFRRIGSDVTHNITRFLRHVLEGKRLKGPRPTAQDLVNWLSLCHRLDWNFEGVVLYEKGGIDLGTLDKGEQAELEQDYLLCKRRLTHTSDLLPDPAEPRSGSCHEVTATSR
jgi:hypothetical protein